MTPLQLSSWRTRVTGLAVRRDGKSTRTHLPFLQVPAIRSNLPSPASTRVCGFHPVPRRRAMWSRAALVERPPSRLSGDLEEP